MPTSWIAVFAAVLVLGVAGWLLARARRVGVKPAVSAMDATPRGAAARQAADDHRLHAARAARAAPPGDATPATERQILEWLCARAFAEAGTAPGAADAAQAEVEAAAVDVLARIDAHPRYTPRRPQLLPQLTRAINDPAASAQSIAAILGQDPALAGNLLRIANSALYRRRGVPVEQLERAVTLLGTEGLRRTAMAALLQPVIADDGSAFARCAALLWDHTLLSADIASRPAGPATRDELHARQLLALLYGLGSVVVVQVLRDTWGKRGHGAPALDALVALLDTWSARCARSISADWGLSSRMQRALEELAEGTGDDGLGELGQALRLSRAQAADRLSIAGSDGPG
ncbi:HDOD domain-containing protein [Luteimonas sp. SDU82]|uniref:HDOD domain-containing protein n=1 Tax=Luteimonas sp. SDU82 TaxID=3422592 RepID=UPI003EBAAE1A